MILLVLELGIALTLCANRIRELEKALHSSAEIQTAEAANDDRVTKGGTYGIYTNQTR